MDKAYPLSKQSSHSPFIGTSLRVKVRFKVDWLGNVVYGGRYMAVVPVRLCESHIDAHENKACSFSTLTLE